MKDQKGVGIMVAVGMPKRMDKGMMNKGMDKDMGMGGHEMMVPMKSLAQEGEDGAVAPEVGDEVEFMCRGKVADVKGDKASVKISHVNGQEYGMEKMENEMMEEEPTDESLAKASKKKDEELENAYI